MAIKIQTQQTYIPIHLGDLELKFDVSDDSMQILRTELIAVKDEIDNLAISEEDEKALNQLKGALKKGFDTLFGDSSFEKVYEISPSVIIVTQYFQQISEALFDELDKRGLSLTPQDKAKKYLANKKK